MQVIVQGQQLDVGDALRGYAEEKLTDTCSRYFNHAVQGNIYFAREASGFRSDITVSVGNGIMLRATATAQADPYPAFDQANNRILKQLKRYKNRLRDHHAANPPAKEGILGAVANEYTLQHSEEEADHIAHGEGGNAPVILAEMPTHVMTLSVSDAVMHMDLGDLPALMFQNAANKRINMVYRRTDGQIGWVDPQE